MFALLLINSTLDIARIIQLCMRIQNLFYFSVSIQLWGDYFSDGLQKNAKNKKIMNLFERQPPGQQSTAGRRVAAVTINYFQSRRKENLTGVRLFTLHCRCANHKKIFSVTRNGFGSQRRKKLISQFARILIINYSFPFNYILI